MSSSSGKSTSQNSRKDAPRAKSADHITKEGTGASLKGSSQNNQKDGTSGKAKSPGSREKNRGTERSSKNVVLPRSSSASTRRSLASSSEEMEAQQSTETSRRKDGKVHPRTSSQNRKDADSNDSHRDSHRSNTSSLSSHSSQEHHKTKSPKGDASKTLENDGNKDSGVAGDSSNSRDGVEFEDPVTQDSRTPRTTRIIDPNAPLRLLILSSKIKNSTTMQNALVGNALLVQYKYESSTLDSILGKLCSTRSFLLL